MTEEKTCKCCNRTCHINDMKKDVRNKSGYSSYCRQCHQQASVKWQREHPERVNETRRRRYIREKERLNAQRRASSNPEKCWEGRIQYLYKASASWYAEQLVRQGGVCAICKQSSIGKKRRLAIDHDHTCCSLTPTCGKCNRGLLCDPCNTSLHAVERHKGWLNSATQYLQVHKEESCNLIQ